MRVAPLARDVLVSSGATKMDHFNQAVLQNSLNSFAFSRNLIITIFELLMKLEAERRILKERRRRARYM